MGKISQKKTFFFGSFPNDDADNDDDDKDDDDEVLGVRCLSAGEHANPQSGEHQSCRPRGGSMH